MVEQIKNDAALMINYPKQSMKWMVEAVMDYADEITFAGIVMTIIVTILTLV